MYSQFYIANQLPQIDNALNFQKCLVVGNWLMLASFLIVSMCVAITFGFEESFGIPAQVSAHIATIVFAGLLKIGYVLRCVALHAFGVKVF
ncbi:hypothetical protein RI845_00990 [Thalassotalea nanhaiensis]|uniref:Uncharacterized protein n=1 Tax=Thalassotalea nanhaiensis TaxID=3065648 RepID=A0ABY9TIT6_9GAMM|nr:hypothetical protein RI845_00990 [Colwelliaceae bacterium SQ345]